VAKLSETEQVAAYMEALDHPLKAEVETLRTIIKSTGPLSERIKWNAPSYYHKEDFVTFNLHDKKTIRLIFIIRPSSPSRLTSSKATGKIGELYTSKMLRKLHQRRLSWYGSLKNGFR